MASNLLAGFVKGFTSRSLDQIDKRQQEEAERKKAEMLERLRRETAEYTLALQEKSDAKKVDDKLSSVDYTTGQKILRNEMGQEIGTLDVTGSEAEAYRRSLAESDLDLQDKRLGLDVKRANINQSNAAAETSRAYATRARSLDSRKAKKEEDDITNKMLVAEYERTFEELEAAGANPAVLANFQTMYHKGITEDDWSKEQQRAFFNQMRRTFTQDWTDQQGRKRKPLFETYGAANAALDAKIGN